MSAFKSNCEECPINTQINTQGDACDACPSGKYTNVVGGTCTDCEAGFYTIDPPSGGYTDINCSHYGDFTNDYPGLCNVSGTMVTYYDPLVGLKCLKCVEGQYQDQTGQSSCLPWTVCLDGQVEERSPDHTRDRICGSCAQGRYNFLDTCYDCPSGQFMDQENHIYDPPNAVQPCIMIH